MLIGRERLGMATVARSAAAVGKHDSLSRASLSRGRADCEQQLSVNSGIAQIMHARWPVSCDDC